MATRTTTRLHASNPPDDPSPCPTPTGRGRTLSAKRYWRRLPPHEASDRADDVLRARSAGCAGSPSVRDLGCRPRHPPQQDGPTNLPPTVSACSGRDRGCPRHDAVTLCANSRGLPWTYNGFSTNWAKLKGQLEAEGAIQPGLTLKGLRHTVATILAEMGRDHGTIALVLGHATEAMAKHYSRRADMRRQATSAVADFGAELNERKTRVVKPGG